jgi:hypothetical protein
MVPAIFLASGQRTAATVAANLPPLRRNPALGRTKTALSLSFVISSGGDVR